MAISVIKKNMFNYKVVNNTNVAHVLAFSNNFLLDGVPELQTYSVSDYHEQLHEEHTLLVWKHV